MSDPSDSQSDEHSQDAGSSHLSGVPSSLPRMFIPHWLTRRPIPSSADSSVPTSPPTSIPGIPDPSLPTSPIITQTPSPVGGQSSLLVRSSFIPHAPSFRPPSASSRLAGSSTRPSAASVRPAATSTRPAAASTRPSTASVRSVVSPSTIFPSSSREPTIPSPGSTTLTPESASPSDTSTHSSTRSREQTTGNGPSSTPSGEQTTGNGRSGTPSGEQTTGNGRIRITLTANGRLDKQKFSAICRRCFQSHPHGLGYTWSRVPQDIQNIYWREFQKKCYWDTNKYSDDQVYRAYKKKISTRYSDYMSDLRNTGRRPGYVSEAIWKEWLDAWNSPAYKKKREQAKKNRRKGKETEPAGPTHTSGSISHGETCERLTTHLGRTPDAHELFTYTHTRRHDGNTWIDSHSQAVEEEYTRIIAEIDSEQNRADELQAFLQAVGGANNRNRIYGLGAAGYRYFNSDASTSRAPTSPSSPRSRMQSQLNRLQSTVDNMVAFQQRYGPEQEQNHPDRLNLGTSSSQVQDFQEFQVQMRDQIEALQNSIARMQQQIERHEIVGTVTKVGGNVKKYKPGDKVGVGVIVGSCMSCEHCIHDSENYCPKLIFTYNATYHDGTRTQGGYSDMIVVDQHFVLRFPDSLPPDSGAPLLCAGITVYSPMKYYGMTDQPEGKHLGIVGLGGLGHVAVKIAKAFGLKVTVISSSPKKESEAISRLGADAFLLSSDPGKMKSGIGSMDYIIDTVSAVHALAPLLSLLRPNGKLVTLGLPEKPLELPIFPLVLGRKLIGGSDIGGIKETQEMLDFCAKHNITADVEVIRIDEINTAMDRLSKSDVKYRFVIDVGNSLQSQL